MTFEPFRRDVEIRSGEPAPNLNGDERATLERFELAPTPLELTDRGITGAAIEVELPEPAGVEQDPRLDAAARDLVRAAGGLGVDPTGILTDARLRRLYAALVAAGVLDDEAIVGIEVEAIGETVAELDKLREHLEAEARKATLTHGIEQLDPRRNGGR